MKRVVKGESPPEFEAWKSAASADWSPSYASLRNPQKKALHEALLKEQGHVCCYCGRGIAREDSHIEHFRPQELRKDLALDYGNLFASCIRETRPGNPLHCGHAKGNAFDEGEHISPLDNSCERRFIYGQDGAIYAADPADQAARYMNELLRLDLAFLRNRRRAVLDAVFDADFLVTATSEELRQLADVYRAPDANGQLSDFSHVLCRFIEQVLALPGEGRD
jgi:uncharacterized protein (TIGR02646 family)